MTLLRRIEALEQTAPPPDGPTVIFVSFVGAKDGAPDGRRSEWDKHAEYVTVNSKRHAVAADETAEQAVRRIAAAMNPAPSAVVAILSLDAQS